MLHDWGVIAAAFGYIWFLFLVASYGDRLSPTQRGRASALIYPLSLAIYCTSWTFFGSVGFATRTSVDFLAIYIGPILMIALCTPLLRRVIQLAKSQNITSIADFIAARYGKSQAVAATVALIAIIGSVPYIALQLKAVASSLETILSEDQAFSHIPIIGDIALIVTLAMAAFAVLFGTRQTDATEHQHGLMLAVATESIVKLVAFIAAGAFVTFWMFTPVELVERAMKTPEAVRAINYVPSIGNFLTMVLLSFCAIMLLPRQFHVSVVENSSDAEVSRARWLFPLYLVAINLFVIPIALAGLMTFPFGAVDSDMYVLALPIEGNAPLLSVGVFVGGLSAATAMVIVECVALSIMVSNDIVVPLVLQRGRAIARRPEGFWRLPAQGPPLCDFRHHGDGVFLLSRARQHPTGGDRPVVVRGHRAACAGVLRRPVLAARDRARRHGRHAGRLCGVGLHAVSAELPGRQHRRPDAAAARPVRHRGAAPAGAVRRRSAAAAARRALVAFAQPADLYRAVAGAPAVLDRTVAGGSVRAERAGADDADIPALAHHGDGAGHPEHGGAISRPRPRPAFVRSLRRSRTASSLDPAAPADFELLQHAEHLIASSIGAASSRLVMSLLLRKRTVSAKAALKLLDDSHAALHFNREILQTALNHVRQGIAVFDADLQLICSNRQFGEILGLPPHLVQIGIPLREILEFMGAISPPGFGDSEALMERRLAAYTTEGEPYLERLPDRHMVIEVRTNRMPGGGLVITFSDVTPSFEAAEALERANATLEKRVRDRTEELTRLNSELALAKSTAEDANISKTRFLAAASHDILQPLNAARLYVTSLVERQNGGEDSRLVENIDNSLEAIEEILGALLDISRLDAGAMATVDHELQDQRPDAFAGDRICADRARQGVEADICALLAAGGIRSPAAAAAVAEPDLQRHQIYPARARAGRLPASRPVAADRRLRHRRRHSHSQARRDLQGVSPPRAGRADRARPWAGAVDRRAARPRPQPRHRARFQCQRRLGFLGDGADRESHQLHRGRHQRDAAVADADERLADRLHRERCGDPGRHAEHC